jgi:hypothetical protein
MATSTRTDPIPNVRRLAQYRPFERGGVDLRAVLFDLVLAVGAIGDGVIESLFECRKSFLDLWSLEVEIDELCPVIDSMIESGVAERKGKAICLSPSVVNELEGKARNSQEIEDRAFREWELSVRQIAPGISDDDMSLLGSDLREWLYLIITWHGADAALMLYPEDDRARRFFADIDARGFDSLPERDAHLHQLRSDVLPVFIRNSTPDQRRFLGLLLNTSFYMTVLTIDPAAQQLVQTQMRGHRIYLDTNFLYAVLGAAPPDEVYSSRRLMKMSKELGFEFAVTPWTMIELRTSIARSRREINDQRQFIRPELAETMLSTSGDKGFNRLFWHAYKEKKTQPKDVFDRLEHFDKELADYGIVETKEGCKQIEQQEERILLYASLVGAVRWPFTKEPVVHEHDAKCRLLIERLRGDGNLTVSNARYWFLTYDTKLPRFASKVPDNGDETPNLPFCISPSAWVQIIRALTPRTDDFDRTIVDLLTSPYVGYRRAVNPVVVQEVIGRMDHMEDASPEMAVAILTDTAVVSEIEEATATEDEDTVGEAVVIAYSTKAQEMQMVVEASQRRVAETEAAQKKAEARAADAELERTRDRQAAEKTHQHEREQWDAEKQTLKDQMRSIEQDRDQTKVHADTANERIEAMEARLEEDRKQRRRVYRIAAGLVIIAIGISLALVSSLILFKDRWTVGGAIVGGMALVLLGIRVVAGKQWGGEFATWASLLTAIASVVGVIITASH